MHPSICGSENNRNLNQMPVFIDNTTIGLASDTIDLTNFPDAFVQRSVDFLKKVSTHNQTDLGVIDLTEDSAESAININNASNISRINKTLNLIGEMMPDVQSALSPIPHFVDLTEESDQFSTTTDDRSIDAGTNALTRLSDTTLWDDQNSGLHLPTIVDFTEEFALNLIASISPPELSTAQVMEDSGTNALTRLSDTILRDEQNSGLHLPTIVDLTEESHLNPVASISPPELSTAQVMEDSSTNALTRLSDTTLRDEQNSGLPLQPDSTESILCPVTTTGPSNQSACAMDWENIDKLKELVEHFEALQKKISSLENVDVDLNDEDDTSFLLINEYKTQACQIYERIRKISGKTAKRANDRIRFNGTPYPDFNAKLEQYINKKKRLPIFGNTLNCFKKYSQDNNLQLSHAECYRVVRKSLSNVGKKLQKQRKRSLNETFSYYLKDQADPADLDPVLRAKLERNSNAMM